MQLVELLPKSFLDRIEEPRLTRMPIHQGNNIVRKADVLYCRLFPKARDFLSPLQHPIYLVEIEVGEQRRNHTALRNTPASRGFQDLLQQAHDRAIIDAYGNLLQQEMMTHVVEVGSKIQIDDTGLAVNNPLTNSQYRIVRRFLRAVTKRSRLKVRFEDRLQDELQRTLDHSIAERRNREHPEFSPRLRNPYAPYPFGHVRARYQLLAQLLEELRTSRTRQGKQRSPRN